MVSALPTPILGARASNGVGGKLTNSMPPEGTGRHDGGGGTLTYAVRYVRRYRVPSRSASTLSCDDTGDRAYWVRSGEADWASSILSASLTLSVTLSSSAR